LDQEIKAVMSAVFGVPVDHIHEDTSPETLAEWTSLTHMSLVMALEEVFSVQFTDEQIVDLLSIAQIRQVLKAIGTNV
jgi:acyl carrier protein